MKIRMLFLLTIIAGVICLSCCMAESSSPGSGSSSETESQIIPSTAVNVVQRLNMQIKEYVMMHDDRFSDLYSGCRMDEDKNLVIMVVEDPEYCRKFIENNFDAIEKMRFEQSDRGNSYKELVETYQFCLDLKDEIQNEQSAEDTEENTSVLIAKYLHFYFREKENVINTYYWIDKDTTEKSFMDAFHERFSENDRLFNFKKEVIPVLYEEQ